MPQKRIDETFAWSKKLFDLSHEEKMLAPHPPKVRCPPPIKPRDLAHRSVPDHPFHLHQGDQHRGYSGIGVEQVSQMCVLSAANLLHVL